jgi:uncharacterized protein YbaP (TraB family)
MNRREVLIGGACALAFAGSALAADSTPMQPEALEELAEVLVIGEQPGPGLWKVSRDDHVLWIMGVYAPLPKKMTWNSTQVEARIATSQEVLFPGNVRTDLDVGFFRGLTSLPSMFTAGKNPDGATLQDVLPADVFARWSGLQRKYMPNDSVARMRPPFAAQSLSNHAYSRAGLGGDSGVSGEVLKLAKRHKVKITKLPDREVEIKIRGTRELLKKYSRTPLAGVECFTRAVNQFEGDLAALTSRANAWATGDVAKFRELHDYQLAPNCVGEMIGSLLAESFQKGTAMEAAIPKYQEELELATKQQIEAWLRATENALARNKATFAVMYIGSLLQPDGFLNRMRQLGYRVEEPDNR